MHAAKIEWSSTFIFLCVCNWTCYLLLVCSVLFVFRSVRPLAVCYAFGRTSCFHNTVRSQCVRFIVTCKTISHRIHVWYIEPTFTMKMKPNVGKYTVRPMDPLGIARDFGTRRTSIKHG